jgi:hypothetical protein
MVSRSVMVGVEFDPRDVRQWRPKVTQLRPVLESKTIVGPALSLDIIPNHAQQFMPREREVDNIADTVLEALVAGRLIDFGHLPNAVIMQGGDGGGPLYTQGALGHPFIRPWLLFHTPGPRQRRG